MTKPDRPLAVKGCGCGFFLAVGFVTWGLTVLGVSRQVAFGFAGGTAIISLIVYAINERKAQKVLNHDYRIATDKGTGPTRREKACPFCGESILAVAIKCKHCQSSLEGPKLATVGSKPTATPAAEQQAQQEPRPGRVECVLCDQATLLPDASPGTQYTCPHCNERVEVPE